MNSIGLVGGRQCTEVGCTIIGEEVDEQNFALKAIETVCIAYFTWELVFRFLIAP